MRATLAVSTLLFAVSGCGMVMSNQSQTMTCDQPEDLSTLSGTYKSSEKLTINQLGPVDSTETWSLKFDKQGYITGEKGWESTKYFGHNAAGAKVQSDSEKIIGLVKDCKIAVVETKENGMAHGELMNDQSITISMLQSGEKPVVTMMKLVKFE